MPKRKLHPVSRDRFQALKRLNNNVREEHESGESTCWNPEDFDLVMQYRSYFCQAGRGNHAADVYACTIESYLLEAMAMMIEAADVDPEYWAEAIERVSKAFSVDPREDVDYLQLLQNRFIPEAVPSAQTLKNQIYTSDLEYMQHKHENRQGEQMEMDL